MQNLEGVLEGNKTKTVLNTNDDAHFWGQPSGMCRLRGKDMEALLDMSNEQLVDLFPCRARRRFTHRGVVRKEMALLKKLRKAVMLLSWLPFF